MGNLLDLDVRIQRIQEEIRKRQPVRERAQLAQSVVAQRPSGLRLDTTVPGNIEVSWNRSPNSDVLYYELQFSPDPTFPEDNRDSERVPGSKTELSYTNGIPGQETFFRMRTVNRTGPSPWSSIVSGTRPGRAVAPTVEVGASTALTQIVQTELNPVLLDTAGPVQVGEYGFLEAESTGDVFLVVGHLIASWGLRYPTGTEAGYYIRLKEDGVTINEAEEAILESITSEEHVVSGALPAIVVPTAPPPGNHVYSVELEVYTVGPDTHSTINLAGGELRLAVLDLRR